MKRIALLSAFVLILTLRPWDADAECSMCKAIVETNDQAANTGAANVSAGINNGILYLMGSVYTVLMILAYIFFKGPIQERLKASRERK